MSAAGGVFDTISSSQAQPKKGQYHGVIKTMPVNPEQPDVPEQQLPSTQDEVPCLNFFFKDRVTDEPKLLHLHPVRDKDIVAGILDELKEHGHSESVFVSTVAPDVVGFTLREFTREYSQCIATLYPELATHYCLELY